MECQPRVFNVAQLFPINRHQQGDFFRQRRQADENTLSPGGEAVLFLYRVLKGPGVFKGRGCSWGTLRIPFGKIGVP